MWRADAIAGRLAIRRTKDEKCCKLWTWRGNLNHHDSDLLTKPNLETSACVVASTTNTQRWRRVRKCQHGRPSSATSCCCLESDTTTSSTPTKRYRPLTDPKRQTKKQRLSATDFVYWTFLSLLLSLSYVDSHVVKVHLDVQGDHSVPNKFQFWTDDNHGKNWVHVNGQSIQTFEVSSDSGRIHLLGVHYHSATVSYYYVNVDKGTRHELRETIKPNKDISKLKVIEDQTGDGLGDGTEVLVLFGVHSPTEIKVPLKDHHHGQLYIDAPKGVLVSWTINSPRHQRHLPFPDSYHDVTPFHKERKLLKTVNLEIHVCLHDVNGHRHASERDGVVDVLLDYDGSSSSSKREIFKLDENGNAFLENVISPRPGDKLEIKVESTIKRSSDFRRHDENHHQTKSGKTHIVRHHDDGPIHIDFCHLHEHIVVVVHNGDDGSKVSGVNVKVKSESAQMQSLSDNNGAAFFTLEDDHKIQVRIDEDGWEQVKFTKSIETHHTNVIHVKLFQRKTVRIEVEDGDDTPMGAVLQYEVGHHTKVIEPLVRGSLDLSSNNNQVRDVKAFVPWQSTCGGNHHHPAKRHVLGEATLDTLDFSHHNYKKVMQLPRLDKIHFEMNLHGTYPDDIKLSTDVLQHRTISLDDNIRGDSIQLYVDVGSQSAHLLTTELYNSEVTLSPLNPCRSMDEFNGNRLTIRQSIYDHTVLVVLKTVDLDYRPIRNVTIEYIFEPTVLGKNKMDVNEESEVVFRVPEGHLVTFIAKSKFKPAENNPSAFVARSKLEVYLVFDTRKHHRVVTSLVADGFYVPEETLVRYTVYDRDGDVLTNDNLFTDEHSKIEFKTTNEAEYIEFDVQGSDGFQPVFYQPFIYVHNITSHPDHWPSPLKIKIPITTKKNVVVAARDCHTGEPLTNGVFVRVPADAPVPHSPFDASLMMDRHLSYVDRRGMAFFNLRTDTKIKVSVTASGFHDFTDFITIARKPTTYFVEANLCQKSHRHVKARVFDGVSHVPDIAAKVYFDDKHEASVTSDDDGYVQFPVKSRVNNICLRIDRLKEPHIEYNEETKKFLNSGKIRLGLCDL